MAKSQRQRETVDGSVPAADPAGSKDANTAAGEPEAQLPSLRLWSLPASMAVVLLTAILLVAGLFLSAMWYASFPTIRRDGVVTTATIFELLKIVFAVVAGLGGVAALVVAYRRQRVAEHASRLAEFSNKLAHAADARAEFARELSRTADARAQIESERNGVRLFNERFTTASEQIGSDKAAIRLAGVYSMAGLADDWSDGRQTCVDVLCAYIRMPYEPPHETRPENDTDVSAYLAAKQEHEVRQTVIRLISSHLKGTSEVTWQGLNFDFSGAAIDGADFSGVTLEGGSMTFDRATVFRRTSFRKARFAGTKLSFRDMRVRSALHFQGATFVSSETNFSHVCVDGGVLDLSDASIEAGKFVFLEANFESGNISFERAVFNLEVAFFAGAEFWPDSRVSFEGAKRQNAGVHTDFYRAMMHGGMVTLPNGEVTREQPEATDFPVIDSEEQSTH
ncbi:pentapeptide repeat-containing protein [Jidongwangia harbinensis]|uniref:pentapeptide repeat-containing protein n=1 Tax=Jidongwangia harbinensis TaxID=2878561 RepID=UPI001CD93DD6|nr:hypothetical protein [Jidongwangia harbinensis]MCA2219502.1 hypothetical protein [Jidongwangia harbinensis]